MAGLIENCSKRGLNPETNTAFDWLEADDHGSFRFHGGAFSVVGITSNQPAHLLKANQILPNAGWFFHRDDR